MKKLTAKQGLISAVFGLAAGASVGILPLILMIFPALLGFVGTAWGYGALGISAAAACGADGLMIEVHNNPSCALCDGAQSLTPHQFDEVNRRVRKIREAIV